MTPEQRQVLAERLAASKQRTITLSDFHYRMILEGIRDPQDRRRVAHLVRAWKQ